MLLVEQCNGYRILCLVEQRRPTCGVAVEICGTRVFATNHPILSLIGVATVIAFLKVKFSVDFGLSLVTVSA